MVATAVGERDHSFVIERMALAPGDDTDDLDDVK